MRQYIVDSNFFIQAHRETYPIDVVSSFWHKIKQLASDGKIISIDKVHAEICDNSSDILSIWCKDNLMKEFFLNSASVTGQYTQVVQAAERRIPAYNKRAKDEFYDAKEADAWLIAHAMALGSTIVTHEVSKPDKIGKVKIPDICNMLGIKTITTIQMFRELGEKF